MCWLYLWLHCKQNPSLNLGRGRGKGTTWTIQKIFKQWKKKGIHSKGEKHAECYFLFMLWKHLCIPGPDPANHPQDLGPDPDRQQLSFSKQWFAAFAASCLRCHLLQCPQVSRAREHPSGQGLGSPAQSLPAVGISPACGRPGHPSPCLLTPWSGHMGCGDWCRGQLQSHWGTLGLVQGQGGGTALSCHLWGHHRSKCRDHTHTLMALFWIQVHFLGTGGRAIITAFSTHLLESGGSHCSHSSSHPGHEVHPDVSPEDLSSMVLFWAPLPSPSALHFLCTARRYLFFIFCLHLQLLPDMAENTNMTVVFREILALQVQKVPSAGSGKQH